MQATDFLALAASDPDAANRHIAQLLGVEPAALYVANSPAAFFEMWDALPREQGEWGFGECEDGRIAVWCAPRGVPIPLWPLCQYAPTRNLAVAAALSEAMHEEKDDG